jgi:hypothetical protein
MPKPYSKKPGKNIAKISQEHPDWSQKKKVAAGFNMAREAGAKIPKKKKGR